MFTFDDAIDKFISKLPWGLKALYQQDHYRNEFPIYCSECGWYYPHDNWLSPYCPMCKNNQLTKVDNTVRQLGLFGELF